MICSTSTTINCAPPSFPTRRSSDLLTTRVLENGGTILWTGAGDIFMNSGAVITNHPGALFEVQNAASFRSVEHALHSSNAVTLCAFFCLEKNTFVNGPSFSNCGAGV